MKKFSYFFISIYIGLVCVELIFSLTDYLKNGVFIFGKNNFYAPIKFSIIGGGIAFFTNMLPDSSDRKEK